MNQLDVALAARSLCDGKAKRIALFCHRHLTKQPLAIVLWQLGAEPFSAAAIGYGSGSQKYEFVVAGDPRNRDLAFAALLRFAHWFNPRFEAPATHREIVRRGAMNFTRASSAPQILVANGGTIDSLGNIGRRLAYLRQDGPKPAPAELVRLGQHLLFLRRHARVPGQQLIVSLTTLLANHWATALSELEQISLPAFNAYIASPSGLHGFCAATEAEKYTIGPIPAGEDDERLDSIVAEFNRRRADSTEPTLVAPLLAPIQAHYEPLIKRTWKLIWECRDREASWKESPSVGRRWDVDRDDYTQHIDWTTRNGRRRTRHTPRQAAMLLRQLEEAKALVQAEEACDDQLKMIPYLLNNKAVQGEVVQVDSNYYEMGPARRVRRPLVKISSPDPCLMPVGKSFGGLVHPMGAHMKFTKWIPDSTVVLWSH
jgi:hypothetical protein